MLIRDVTEPKAYPKKRKGLDFRSTILTERFLSMMLKVVSNPEFVKVKRLQNIQSFVNATPLYLFEKDQTVYALILSIKCVLRNKLEGAVEIEDLVEYVNIDLGDQFGDIKDNIIFPVILSSTEATERETKLVTKTCDKLLRYETILIRKDELADAITDIGSGNISNLDEAISELRDIIADLNNEFSKTDSNEDELSIYHTSRPDEFKEKFKEAYEYENSPKMCLHVGLKAFDKMISPRGGFLGGTFNLFMADTNTFKSALLENIKRWIQKYNSNMFKEEYLRTGKRPTIIFVSLENGSKEDISRDFSIASKKNMYDCDSFETAFQMYQDEFKDTIIEVTQINAGDYKFNMSSLKQVIKRVEEDGFFVIGIIVDSFDLMSPDEEDIRLRVSDETTLLLNRSRRIEKWISDKPYPFISAHQLNREAARAIAEARQKGNIDLCKFLDRQHVSGSYDILRRAHFTAFIYTEISKYDGEKYLEVRRDKTRYRSSDSEYSYFVTKLHNGFFIEDDLNTDKCTCRSSIMPMEDGSQGMTVGIRGLASLQQIQTTDTKPVENNNFVSSEKKEINTSNIKPMFSSENNTQNYIALQLQQNYFAMCNNIMMMNYIMNKNAGITPFDYDKRERYAPVSEVGITPFDLAM